MPSDGLRRDLKAIHFDTSAPVDEPLRLSGDYPGRAVLQKDRPGRILIPTEPQERRLLISSVNFHECRLDWVAERPSPCAGSTATS